MFYYIPSFEFQMERKSEGQILVNEIISQLKTKEVRIFVSLKRFHKTFSKKRLTVLIKNKLRFVRSLQVKAS